MVKGITRCDELKRIIALMNKETLDNFHMILGRNKVSDDPQNSFSCYIPQIS